MNEPAILVVWIVGLSVIVGIVLAALTAMVRRDTIRYDRQFTWQTYPHWEQYERDAERAGDG